ncbi:thiamine phosphate synthase [Acidovorax sp. FJL06]|uniref:thiamine phosphate synthase n=1 Tax=Acidovorax sp. FJL06 TaxID=2153365 RepID=UPI0018F70126|nr:thiamine phosphate synthase [Acidovorax sp. FJL06]
MRDTAALAQEILAHHAATFAGFAPEPVPTPTRQDQAYLAALQACSALGFIAHDAECLAQAWQARTERTGRQEPALWPDGPEDFGLQPVPRAQAFAACPQNLGLYAVLPDAGWVGRMARAGVPTVQLRFKSDDAAAIEREVRAAVQAVQGTGALLFINDHWRVAIAAGAYGIHLGQEDLDALDAQALQVLRGSGLRLGVSTHGYAEMVRADAVGPSYVAMGAVFPTTLKRMATAPQGVGRLGVYARLLRHYPQVAIGGIGAEQFAQVLATGVGSIAVVRALVNAPHPEDTAAQLMKRMQAPVPGNS